MSRTPVSTSGEVIVAVASHLSNVPSIATDAFTWNLIELSSFVILMMGTSAGACACVIDGDRPDAKRQKITSRIPRSLSPSHLVSNWQKLQVERQPLTLAPSGRIVPELRRSRE